MANPTETDLQYTTASYNPSSDELKFNGKKFQDVGVVQDSSSGTDDPKYLGDINKGDNSQTDSVYAEVYQRDGFNAGKLGFLNYYGTVTVKGRTGFLASNQKHITSGQKWYVFFRKSDAKYFYQSSSQKAHVNIAKDGKNGWKIKDVCFLEDTQISTPSGAVSIQNLRAGDQVNVIVNGENSVKNITWVGKSSTITRSNLPDDQAGYPIRILKHAIAENVPFKDMLITAEHCLYFAGCFVPARMLVNNYSIFYDKSFASYSYYHIETEDHSIITADGVLTESYLDTGNRQSFLQKDHTVAFIKSRRLTWEQAAAPLNVTQHFVEPIFNDIKKRANNIKLSMKTAEKNITYDHNLHLITNTGAIIPIMRKRNNHYIFSLPQNTKFVRIVSRASRPCDTVGPYVDDRRYFGMAISDIILFENNHSHAITTHFSKEELTGWNLLDTPDMRWTDGDAFLPIPQIPGKGKSLLAIKANPSHYYIYDEINAQKTA